MYSGVAWLCDAVLFSFGVLVSATVTRSLYHKLLGKMYCHLLNALEQYLTYNRPLNWGCRWQAMERTLDSDTKKGEF